jgi:hypothetical protein
MKHVYSTYNVMDLEYLYILKWIITNEYSVTLDGQSTCMHVRTT